jgi:hypothetical protein
MDAKSGADAGDAGLGLAATHTQPLYASLYGSELRVP